MALAQPPHHGTGDGGPSPLQRRPAQGSITLLHLLTHTSGFSYEIWDAKTVRDVQVTERSLTVIGNVVCQGLGRL